MASTAWPMRLRVAMGAVLLGLAMGAAGQKQGAAEASAASQVAAEALANEVKIIQYDRSYLRYRIHVKDAKGDVVREVIESKDGSVTRVLQRDDRALSADEESKERERLQEMLDSSRAFERQADRDKTGKKVAIDLIQRMPEAMTFEFVAGQPQREGRGAATPEIVIDFKPKAEWKPPTMASQALTGIEGRCWIDPTTHFMTRLEATIFAGVNFGWGVLAHIYPGGKLTVEQVPVGNTRWIIDRFTGRLTVREMMLRTVNQNTDLFAFGFQQVPEMGYQDAIRQLLTTPVQMPDAGGR